MNFDQMEELAHHSADVGSNDKFIRREATALVVSYARDIVNMWPTISFRTLRSLNDKVKGLKEALEMLK